MTKVLRGVCAFITLLYACRHDPIETPPSTVSTSSTASTTSSTTTSGNDSVCFNTRILPLFQSNCAQSGCHDAISHQEGYTFTTYNGIMKGINDGEIMKEINKGDMPMAPVPQLTAEKKNLLKKWIAEGAGNRICNDPCDPGNAAFSSGVNTIISTNCTGCHNNNIANGGVNLQGYENVKMQALGGRLVCSIEHGAGCLAMPKNGTKLNNNCITVIKNWIANGTPDN